MYGVRIPLAFWKIIAFIHDETGKLCATGYEMNQEQSLQPEEEFVFGAFTSPQLENRDPGFDPLDRGAQRHRFGKLAERRSAGRPRRGAWRWREKVLLEALEQIKFRMSDGTTKPARSRGVR